MKFQAAFSARTLDDLGGRRDGADRAADGVGRGHEELLNNMSGDVARGAGDEDGFCHCGSDREFELDPNVHFG
ncbi:hypothetical protein BC937DRAFT_92135 [Endogone sp. FLAS-F59071]|nr:hypothetical protein BC937DRAFT_92135 [Endogone sp. FLAS-F59071]|eukprot:RUS15685.1 hypothetical protein BC937DRAFT_92135 [Endogone sp. FLAS-F59071]